MSVKIYNAPWRGTVDIPMSKSVAHRVLIARELDRITLQCPAPDQSEILDRNACDDVRMTAAGIRNIVTAYCSGEAGKAISVDCKASGTTLRFLMPVAAALGVHTRFIMDEGLAVRPHDQLLSIITAHGCTVRRENSPEYCFELCGKLQPGDFTVPGNISSQYISGLMYALPLLDGESTISVVGRIESMPYIEMTIDVLKQHGVSFKPTEMVDGDTLSNPDLTKTVYSFARSDDVHETDGFDGDWSAAAYFFAAMKLSKNSSVLVRGLKDDSCQGDRRIISLLGQFDDNESACRTIDISDVPDLAPVLSVAAAGSEGITVFTGARRLHYKESDRVESIAALINGIGGKVEITSEDEFTVYGHAGWYHGGTVESFRDHRIAMAAAVASLICEGGLVINGEDCVSKSYPGFFDVIERLGAGICRDGELSGSSHVSSVKDLSSLETGTDTGKGYKVIDFHTHIFNDELAARAFPLLKKDAEEFYTPVHDMKKSSLLARMDEYGVDMSVIHPVITKRKQVEPVNLWALSQASSRLMPFGGIYPNADDWKEQIDYVRGLGLKGLKFHCEYQDFVIDDPRMLKIYDYALSKGLIIIHHAGFDPAYPAPYRSSPERFAHIADELRGGVIIAAHLGGSRQWDDVEKYLVGKNIYLDTSMGLQYYPSEQFLRIVKAHGASKMLFATDSPWTGADRELEILLSLPLTEQEREMILHLNAEMLLGL